MEKYEFSAPDSIEVVFAGDAERITVGDDEMAIDVGSDDIRDPLSPLNMPLGPKSGGRAVCIVLNGLGGSPMIDDEATFQQAVASYATDEAVPVVSVTRASASQWGLAIGGVADAGGLGLAE